MKKILLISNKVMHYRVSIYNYLSKEFRKQGWEFIVRSNKLQNENPHPVEFDFREIDFNFSAYKREVEGIRPDVIILFLHLKDLMLWPLIHWLWYKKIPVVNWTKTINLDDADNKVKKLIFNYIHTLCDRLILYSPNERKYLTNNNKRKVFVANNTINFDDFPAVEESREEIKKALQIPFEKVVLSVGRMDVGGQRKKIHHLIQVFRDIDMKGAGLVIVGAGVSRELQQTMNKKNTVYLGEIYDAKNYRISRIFKMADLFSIPGHVGLGLVQAFYFGLPVITEEGLQPPEIHYLINGRNGFIVPENDLNELKKKILFLLENDIERRVFSTNAKNDIHMHGSIRHMYEGFKRCVNSIHK